MSAMMTTSPAPRVGGAGWMLVPALVALAAIAATPTLRDPDYEAISFLGDTLRALPMSADARARAEQQLDQARAAFRRDSTNVDSIIWLGRRLAYLGRFRESIDVYSKGIARYPTNAWLYRHRGHRYITVRQLDRAIADLERAQSLVEGQPDQIEPDGQPNAQNTPIGTLHSNIAYHLGLAYYLKGDYARAVPLYQHEMAAATNDDRRVSTAHWLYMSLRRLGRTGEAANVLKPISRQMKVIENDTYLKLLLLYKGELPPDSLLPPADSAAASVTDATAAYGVGNWHLYNGRTADGARIFHRVLGGGQWAAFGFIAAEADVASGRAPKSAR